MSRQIEDQHVVETKRRIADVRPWGIKTQEKLSETGNFLFFSFFIVVGAIAAPIALPILLAVFLTAHFSVLTLKSLLPYRYPASGIDPQSGKRGDGIMLIGSVRSTSPFESFKQCWLSDGDLRKHWLIMGATGSGKSETLKGIFFNVLCWGSGFFCADGKADNKLPTDGYTMAKAFGREDDILYLNFVLGGKTPQQVQRSRRRHSNRLNPFSSGDADTLIQMGANLLPKAEGDGKAWQEKALVLWRAVITALCYKRDMHGYTMSVERIIDYLSLPMVEELYVEGYKEFVDTGRWTYGYSSIKNYLESGVPGFSIDKLLKKHGLIDQGAPAKPPSKRGGQEFEQDPIAGEQHGYRVSQLMPVLNLLDKTYGFIFSAKFSEIDMIDVALHNRILFLLIPSLEKSAAEAENLGKLTIACLRVMMARNLGSDLEGSYDELIGSKATEANYPYVVALDELGYYFADGIAVMFAQARSMGMSMIAAAQDLEKLTEGSRAAEAGAMIGNAVNKLFMKIDDPKKTWELVSQTIGKVKVATYGAYSAGKGAGGYKRQLHVNVGEEEMISFKEMNSYTEGQAVMNTRGVTSRISTFYMGHWLEKLGNKSFHVNRFLQVAPPTPEEIEQFSIKIEKAKKNEAASANEIHSVLRGSIKLTELAPSAIFSEVSRVTDKLDASISGTGPLERGATIYLALKHLFAQGSPSTRTMPAPAENTPASLAILNPKSSPEFTQALDEHGLPDPLSLIRKPIEEVIKPVEEQPEKILAFHGASPSSSSASDSDPLDHASAFREESSIGDGGLTVPGTGRDALVKPFGAFGVLKNQPPASFDDYDSEAASDPIDNLLKDGRKEGATTQATWVAKSVGEAHAMLKEPRSANGSVIGLSDETLGELEGLERELGSPLPKTAAHTMQKVVSAQITPDTVGKGKITDNQIEDYFNSILNGQG